MRRVKHRLKEQLLTVMDLLDAKLESAVELGPRNTTPETGAAIRELCDAQASLVEALKETHTAGVQTIDGLPDDTPADADLEARFQATLRRTGPKGAPLVFWPPDTCACPSCGEPGFAVEAGVKAAWLRPDSSLPDYARGDAMGVCVACAHSCILAVAAEDQLRDGVGID
jgi:hypothetical protein